MKKKTSSIILTAALAVSLMATPVFAAEVGTDPDETDIEMIGAEEAADEIEEVSGASEETEDSIEEAQEDLSEEVSVDIAEDAEKPIGVIPEELSEEVAEETGETVELAEENEAEDPEESNEDYGIALFASRTALTSEGGELASGNYYLASDITLENGITVGSSKEITIDLNGHTLTGPWITGTGTNSALIIYGTLNLTDSSSDNSGIIEGYACYDDVVVNIRDGGTFIMDGGTICDGPGCGVFNLGSFTMNGGKICDNESSGVYCASDSASFTMNGGEISGNGASNGQGGAGVCIYSGSFTMNGGEIRNNWSNPLSGGGVYVGGKFTMTGGTISENHSDYGGGVYAGGNITIKGGVISGNLDMNGEENNLYLPSGSYISLSGTLTSGSSIGITTENKPTSGKPIQITKAESNTTYYKSSATYFSSDKGYTIQANSSGRYVELSYGSSGGATLNGVCKASDGKWYYYVNGVIDTSYTGFATNENGKWYVEKGLVTKSTNGVFKDKTGALGSSSEWYYVLNSKVQTGFTGLANYSNASGWWYITKGKVDRSYNGLAKNKNGWFYLTKGKVDRSYTGFAENSNGKWYVTKGKLTRKDNTVLKDTAGAIGAKNTWYYVVGSKVQTNFTGLANYSNSSGWWYITKGKVDRSYNGLSKNKNGWFYLTNGKVNRSYTGLATNSNGTWYVKSGKVQKNYTGTVTINGKRYSVKNGKV